MIPAPTPSPRQYATLRAAIATQPDRDVLADMLGLDDEPTQPEPRGRALPRHGGGRRAVTV